MMALQDLKRDIAFPITGSDIFGRQINFNNSKKKHLAFYGFAACPICFHQFFEIKELNEEVGDKIDFFAIYNSSEDVLKMAMAGMNISFHVVSDVDFKFFEAYKVEKSYIKSVGSNLRSEFWKQLNDGKRKMPQRLKKDGDKSTLSAEFLINENGKIEYTHYHQYKGDKMDTNIIRGFVMD